MNRPGRRTTWLGALLGAALTIAAAAGCGAGGTAPSDTVPELRTRLAAVDQAIVDRDFAEARLQLRRLERTTSSAQDAGELDAADADRILAAVDGLRAVLPAPPSPEPTPTPTSTPTPTPEPTEGDDENEGEGNGEGNGEGKEDKEKEDKKDEESDGRDGEGGGNGNSGENGPDDGHGN